MEFETEVMKISRMNQMELNSYEASLKRELQKAEIRRVKAESDRMNHYAEKVNSGCVSDEVVKEYLNCIRALREKNVAERILKYIQNMRMTPAQRMKKIQQLKMELREV